MAATVLTLKQSGNASIPSGSSVVNVAIPVAVTLSKTWLRYSFRCANSGSAQGTRAVAYLQASNNIRVVKDNTGGPTIILEWEVLEFSSGLFAQHGFFNPASATVDTAISSVNTAKSLPLASHFWFDNGFTRSVEGVQGWLTSSTNLRTDTQRNTSGTGIAWQVLQFDNATVQTGAAALTALSATAAITAVTTSKSIAVCGAKDDTGSNVQGADDWSISVRLNASNQITFQHYSTGRNYDVRWHVMSLSDAGFFVQRGAHSFSSAGAENVALATAVTPSAASAISGGKSGHFVRTDDSVAGVGYGPAQCTMKITGANVLEVENDGFSAGDVTILDWQVMDFPAAGVGKRADFMPFFYGRYSGAVR